MTVLVQGQLRRPLVDWSEKSELEFIFTVTHMTLWPWTPCSSPNSEPWVPPRLAVLLRRLDIEGMRHCIQGPAAAGAHPWQALYECGHEGFHQQCSGTTGSWEDSVVHSRRKDTLWLVFKIREIWSLSPLEFVLLRNNTWFFFHN